MNMLKMLMVDIRCVPRVNVRYDGFAVRMVVATLSRMNNRRHYMRFTVHENSPFFKLLYTLLNYEAGGKHVLI